jgi:hypothetical protein
VAGEGRRHRLLADAAKMAEAVQLARLHNPATVNRALGQAATAGRFGHATSPPSCPPSHQHQRNTTAGR